MPRYAEDNEETPLRQRDGHPAWARRILYSEPRTPAFRRKPLRAHDRAPGGDSAAAAVASPSGPLREWHDMTPGEQAVAWAQLRAWVTWLHDRYELSTEERLPRCWAQHPGLVEELCALRTWRAEIYGSGQAAAGQAARYWHAEMRQVLHAAATMYAAGCRAGHRGAPVLATEDAALRELWADAVPLARIPAAEIAAGRARRDGLGGWASGEAMAAALDNGDAVTVPGLRDYACCAGTWWIPAGSGWIQVPPPLPAAGTEDAGTGGPDPWAGQNQAWGAE
jgi:hypothetical protein